MDSCADQEGCTLCDDDDAHWCVPTDFECDTVERNSDGTSKAYFYCEVDTTGNFKDIACENSSDKEFFIIKGFLSLKILFLSAATCKLYYE